MQDGKVHRTHLRMRLSADLDGIATALVHGVSHQPAFTYSHPLTARGALRLLRHDLMSRRSPARFERPMLDARAIEPNNMAHMMCEVLPLCLHARDVAGPDIGFVLRRLDDALKPDILELLAIFGIEPLFLRQPIEAPLIKVSVSRRLALYELPSEATFDCSIIEFFPATFDRFQFPPIEGYDRIFIARRGQRALTNHDAVERVLTAHGYRTVFMEDFSVQQRLRVAANAKRVVAVHGAGMGYLVTNRKMASVIEMMPPNVYHEYYSRVLVGRVGSYCQVMPSYDERVHHLGWDAICNYKFNSFAIDIRLLEKALETVSERCPPATSGKSAGEVAGLGHRV
jgi:hypothetical protein